MRTSFLSTEITAANPAGEEIRWTTSTEVYLAGYKGSPGAKERTTAPIVAATSLARSPFIFNRGREQFN